MSISTGKPPGPPPGSFYRKGTFQEYQNPDIEALDFRFPPATGISVAGGEGVQPPPHIDPPGAAPFVRLQFPPRIEKIAGSVDFRKQDYRLALPAGVGSTVDGPFFRLPQDQVGWLQNNLIYVLTPTAAILFSMAILINDGPVPGFDDIQIPPGLAQFVVLGDDDMRVRIPNAAKVSLRFTNILGVAATVGGLIQGWYHPLAAESRVWGDEV